MCALAPSLNSSRTPAHTQTRTYLPTPIPRIRIHISLTPLHTYAPAPKQLPVAVALSISLWAVIPLYKPVPAPVRFIPAVLAYFARHTRVRTRTHIDSHKNKHTHKHTHTQLPVAVTLSIFLWAVIPLYKPVPAPVRFILAVLAFFSSVAWVAIFGNEV